MPRRNEEAERLADIARQNFVGDAGLLEEDDIIVLAAHHLQAHDRIDRRAREERRVDADDASHACGLMDRHLPDHNPAPIVADEDRVLDGERIEHPGEIAG